MSDRILGGEPRLDEILGGGLLPNAINLIMGLPGSGKTILAQQYLFANATPTAPGLYLTTVSEPLEKVLRYGETLEFFDPTGGRFPRVLRGARAEPGRTVSARAPSSIASSNSSANAHRA